MASTTTGTLPSMMSESFHEAMKMKIRPPTRITVWRTACGTVVSRVSRTTPRSAEIAVAEGAGTLLLEKRHRQADQMGE